MMGMYPPHYNSGYWESRRELEKAWRAPKEAERRAERSMDEALVESFCQNEAAQRCADCDSDCHGVESKTKCWLHDPTRGFCPFLMEGYELPPAMEDKTTDGHRKGD